MARRPFTRTCRRRMAIIFNGACKCKFHSVFCYFLLLRSRVETYLLFAIATGAQFRTCVAEDLWLTPVCSLCCERMQLQQQQQQLCVVTDRRLGVETTSMACDISAPKICYRIIYHVTRCTSLSLSLACLHTSRKFQFSFRCRQIADNGQVLV